MKEPHFNNVSVFPLCLTDKELLDRIESYVKVLKFCKFLGISKVRYSESVVNLLLKENYTLCDFIKDNRNDDKSRLILSMTKYPYIDDNNEIAEEKYVYSKITLKKLEDEISAEGLTCAYCTDSFAIGFNSEKFWSDNILFKLNVVEQDSNKTSEKNIFCISHINQFEHRDFINWAVNNLTLKFRSCNIKKESKKMHFRNDHGIDKLKMFANRILKEEFIISVINSLPFNSNTKNMIGNITDNGIIDIYLTKTDEKFGMAIQTTANSKIEAKYMGFYLEKKYNN